MKKITKPDTNNISRWYWERVLTSHGLGIRGLGLEEKEEQVAVVEGNEVKMVDRDE